MKAVFQLDWNAKCEFAEETRLFLNNDSFSDWFDGLDQIEELTGKLVIDNTPLPSQTLSLDYLVFCLTVAHNPITISL